MSSRVINKFAFHSVSTQNEIYQVQYRPFSLDYLIYETKIND